MPKETIRDYRSLVAVVFSMFVIAAAYASVSTVVANRLHTKLEQEQARSADLKKTNEDLGQQLEKLKFIDQKWRKAADPAFVFLTRNDEEITGIKREPPIPASELGPETLARVLNPCGWDKLPTGCPEKGEYMFIDISPRPSNNPTFSWAR